MKIIITGGAGFIGTRLSQMLDGHGHETICIDTFTETIHGANKRVVEPCYSAIETRSYGDIDYYGPLYQAADVIFLLAAETGMGSSQYHNTLYCDTNILETARVLDFLRRKSSSPHIILPSSCRVYGEGTYECKVHGAFVPSGRELNDLQAGSWSIRCPICASNAEFKPNTYGQPISSSSTYAITKYAQESLALTNSYTASYDATVLRLQNVYGPGQSFNNAYTGLVSVFSQRILNNRPLELYEDGMPSRDFVYIDDVCTSLLAAMHKRHISSGKVYDIGSGMQISVRELAERLLNTSTYSVPIHSSKRFRVGDILNGCADISLAQEDLGWSPKFSLEEGLCMYWNWLLNQGPIADHSMDSDQALIYNNILQGSISL